MSERSVYKKPDWITQHVFNPAVSALTRGGLSLLGSRILRVRGRKSGLWRETPVNLLEFGGGHYLVAPRGETQWVRNLRVAGNGQLRIGRRVQSFEAEEVDAESKVPVLRAYLKRWRWEVGAFFGGVGPDSSDEDLRAEGGSHPVFKLRMMPLADLGT